MESIQTILVVFTKSFKVELSAGSDFVMKVFTLFAHTSVKYLSNCLQNMFLFDCLGFYVPFKNFLLYRHILTYTWHSWSLSIGGSLGCHTNNVTGHLFMIIIFQDLRHGHTCCQAFGGGAVTTCFHDLGLSRLGFEHPTFCMLDERTN